MVKDAGLVATISSRYKAGALQRYLAFGAVGVQLVASPKLQNMCEPVPIRRSRSQARSTARGARPEENVEG